jgi:gamma-glutamyltranspeptidase/glutathione hydrolase
MVEAMSIALEDRDRFVGDRSGLAVDPVTLYEPDRVASLAERFDPRHARDKQRASGAARDFGDTAHLTVVDRDRRAVSLIQSLFFDFGTGIPVPAGGFTLQNRGAAFSLESGSVNELRPRRRPRTTLAPSIAQRDGALSISLGCMGGDGQMQTQTQLLVAMVDAGLDPQQAVSSPRWYLDRAGGPQSRVLFESRMDEALVAGMQARGHATAVLGASEEVMGHAQVIAVERTGSLVGAADPRSDGQVGGW